MSTSNTNPFVLPGLGQDGNLSANPLLASMEMMRKAWAGLAGPGGLAQSLPMTPPMNLEELERRIAELRSVESWLRMNLSMLSSAIQGMEVQRSTIATLRSFVAAGAGGDGSSPLEVVLGLKPAQGTSRETSFSRPENKASAEAGAKVAATYDEAAPPVSADAASMADHMSQAAHSASQAWWNLLQQQFNQIATATASSMPEAAAQPASAASATSSPPTHHASATTPAPRQRAVRKTAAKRAPAARKS